MSYDANFFESIREGSQRSAAAIVPRIMQVVGPGSVIDVGCGEGWWLAEFAKHGVNWISGIDGHSRTSSMPLTSSEYQRFDLSKRFTFELSAGRTYDLALSLEVAEHLPAARAETFVAELCAFAPVVLFSAAIPGQGGEGHVNEQWPSYWAVIFAKLGYEAMNWPRFEFWHDERVELWYRQNMMLFARGPRSAEIGATIWKIRTPLDVVHPRMHKEIVDDVHHDYMVGRRKVGEWKREK